MLEGANYPRDTRGSCFFLYHHIGIKQRLLSCWGTCWRFQFYSRNSVCFFEIQGLFVASFLSNKKVYFFDKVIPGETGETDYAFARNENSLSENWEDEKNLVKWLLQFWSKWVLSRCLWRIQNKRWNFA